MRLDLGLGLGLSGSSGSGLDANTLFLTDFRTASPSNRVDGAAGTLVGNASIDTANQELVLDGAGDWLTFAGGSQFDPTANWTLELHANIAAAQVGGFISRTSAGASRYILYSSGGGNLAFYTEDGAPTPLINAAGVDGTLHHWAFVRDGGTWRQYLDGTQVSSAVWAGAPSASNNTFYIGVDVFDTVNRDVAGRIARVKISNVARYPSGTAFTPPGRTDL